MQPASQISIDTGLILFLLAEHMLPHRNTPLGKQLGLEENERVGEEIGLYLGLTTKELDAITVGRFTVRDLLAGLFTDTAKRISDSFAHLIGFEQGNNLHEVYPSIVFSEKVKKELLDEVRRKVQKDGLEVPPESRTLGNVLEKAWRESGTQVNWRTEAEVPLEDPQRVGANRTMELNGDAAKLSLGEIPFKDEQGAVKCSQLVGYGADEIVLNEVTETIRELEDALKRHTESERVVLRSMAIPSSEAATLHKQRELEQHDEDRQEILARLKNLGKLKRLMKERMDSAPRSQQQHRSPTGGIPLLSRDVSDPKAASILPVDFNVPGAKENYLSELLQGEPLPGLDAHGRERVAKQDVVDHAPALKQFTATTNEQPLLPLQHLESTLEDLVDMASGGALGKDWKDVDLVDERPYEPFNIQAVKSMGTETGVPIDAPKLVGLEEDFGEKDDWLGKHYGTTAAERRMEEAIERGRGRPHSVSPAGYHVAEELQPLPGMAPDPDDDHPPPFTTWHVDDSNPKFADPRLDNPMKREHQTYTRCRICHPGENDERPPEILKDVEGVDSRRPLEPMNVPYLLKFMSSMGAVLPAKSTKLCAKHQRAVARVVKRAKAMGFFAYKKGQFVVDSPYFKSLNEPEIQAKMGLRAIFGSPELLETVGQIHAHEVEKEMEELKVGGSPQDQLTWGFASDILESSSLLEEHWEGVVNEPWEREWQAQEAQTLGNDPYEQELAEGILQQAGVPEEDMEDEMRSIFATQVRRHEFEEGESAEQAAERMAHKWDKALEKYSARFTEEGLKLLRRARDRDVARLRQLGDHVPGAMDLADESCVGEVAREMRSGLSGAVLDNETSLDSWVDDPVWKEDEERDANDPAHSLLEKSLDRLNTDPAIEDAHRRHDEISKKVIPAVGAIEQKVYEEMNEHHPEALEMYHKMNRYREKMEKFEHRLRELRELGPRADEVQYLDEDGNIRCSKTDIILHRKPKMPRFPPSSMDDGSDAEDFHLVVPDESRARHDCPKEVDSFSSLKGMADEVYTEGSSGGIFLPRYQTDISDGSDSDDYEFGGERSGGDASEVDSEVDSDFDEPISGPDIDYPSDSDRQYVAGSDHNSPSGSSGDKASFSDGDDVSFSGSDLEYGESDLESASDGASDLEWGSDGYSSVDASGSDAEYGSGGSDMDGESGAEHDFELDAPRDSAGSGSDRDGFSSGGELSGDDDLYGDHASESDGALARDPMSDVEFGSGSEGEHSDRGSELDSEEEEQEREREKVTVAPMPAHPAFAPETVYNAASKARFDAGFDAKLLLEEEAWDEFVAEQRGQNNLDTYSVEKAMFPIRTMPENPTGNEMNKAIAKKASDFLVQREVGYIEAQITELEAALRDAEDGTWERTLRQEILEHSPGNFGEDESPDYTSGEDDGMLGWSARRLAEARADDAAAKAADTFPVSDGESDDLSDAEGWGTPARRF
eukprot:TRINITY_DN3463_c0_g2_i5.p1 TRINITY_DN3463_c0_g2~~TRINITY_DN3463_c0_g2_i5.p1  ORF type:complete len:1456 (-),score=317.74 TRINITY_DN3463_c0_g2_i5:63-4430(-)